MKQYLVPALITFVVVLAAMWTMNKYQAKKAESVKA